MNSDINELLDAIDQLNTSLASYEIDKSLLESLHEEFKVDYTYNSNAIEGNTLSLEETRVVLDGITIGGKSVKEHLEAINHKEAIEHMEELVKRNTPLSERCICELHAIILQGINKQEAGKYRNAIVEVGGFMPPQPYLLQKQMEDFIHHYHNLNAHPILKASYAHLEFVRIHPFIDGNGRTARLLMNLELLKSGYCAINIRADKDKRVEYYEAIREYSNFKKGTHKFDQLVARYVYETLKEKQELCLAIAKNNKRMQAKSKPKKR